MMKIRDFSAGSHHAAMVDELGRVFTWGAGSYGRLVIIIPYAPMMGWRMRMLLQLFVDKKGVHLGGLAAMEGSSC